MKILTVIGARPQFVKASVVSRAIAETQAASEVILHTGQHFDANMSGVFFSQLDIPNPSYHLGVNSSSHGAMTGRMLEGIEEVLLKERPDKVLVYGDTNSTLAGALAAAKLHIAVGHVEAGLRSFNMKMPEEINRILTDNVSEYLFCPTEKAVENLEIEGVSGRGANVLMVGDVMQDAALHFSRFATAPPGIDGKSGFVLATLHRAENTDCFDRLASIVTALNRVHEEVAEVVLPLHPRTAKALASASLVLNVTVIPPVGYFEMLWLLSRSKLVLTDSGGVQKEAFFFGQPCVTMRDETEWSELVDIGANVLVGSDAPSIYAAASALYGKAVEGHSSLYGGGTAAKKIARHLTGHEDS